MLKLIKMLVPKRAKTDPKYEAYFKYIAEWDR